MVSKYTEKNKFGNYTWKIEVDKLFHIFILGTESSSFVVEFKEWRWLSYKTHFTYVTTNDLEMAINEVFIKVFTFFKNKENYVWTENQKNQKLNIVLKAFKNMGDIANLKNLEVETIIGQSTKKGTIERLDEAKFDNSLQSNSALDLASFFLKQGHLILAIDALEDFTDLHGDNLPVLIMLARLKILSKSQFEVKLLIIKILAIMEENIGLTPEEEMEEFELVMEEFQKM